MVLKVFCEKRKSKLATTDRNQNASLYRSKPRDYVPSCVSNMFQEKYILQQDNDSIYKANMTKKWFIENDVDAMHQPTTNRDLNRIENIWGVWGRAVYAEERQCSDVGQPRNLL